MLSFRARAENIVKKVCLDKLKANYCKAIKESTNPFDWIMYDYAIQALETELYQQGLITQDQLTV